MNARMLSLLVVAGMALWTTGCFHQKTDLGPKAEFSFSPASPKVGEDVLFDASNSQATDGQIIEYLWDFGDGATEEGPIVIHRYSATGRYLVKLTVKDDKNRTNSVEKALQVIEELASRSLPAPGPSPIGLAWDGQALWVADTLDLKLYKIDLQTGALLTSLPLPTEIPDGLAWDGKNLWVVDGMDGKLLQIDPSNGKVSKSLVAPGDVPTGLTWDGNSLWVADLDALKIYKINAITGKVIDVFNAPGDAPAGLAWDGQYLWHSDGGGRLYKLDPRGGQVLGEYDAPGLDPAGLAWDGQYLWVSDSIEKKLYKIDTKSL
ncbi:PKD domain-containing protein [Candidatus Acetothermia bacterium]|nr:PKD domain-containing protein [Candidatus Acetothermia bacterium]MCI2436675.1 PKD domain-containing protein [Candidatus Acetothermia bacterium]